MKFQANTKPSIFKGDTTEMPLHHMAQSMVFRDELEANLIDAVSRVAEQNGMSANDVTHVTPYILRMLKSQSAWAK